MPALHQFVSAARPPIPPPATITFFGFAACVGLARTADAPSADTRSKKARLPRFPFIEAELFRGAAYGARASATADRALSFPARSTESARSGTACPTRILLVAVGGYFQKVAETLEIAVLRRAVQTVAAQVGFGVSFPTDFDGAYAGDGGEAGGNGGREHVFRCDGNRRGDLARRLLTERLDGVFVSAIPLSGRIEVFGGRGSRRGRSDSPHREPSGTPDNSCPWRAR